MRMTMCIDPVFAVGELLRRRRARRRTRVCAWNSLFAGFLDPHSILTQSSLNPHSILTQASPRSHTGPTRGRQGCENILFGQRCGIRPSYKVQRTKPSST